MIGCASCLCASRTQQHFASWRDAVSPRHRPSTTGLRANTAAVASAWTTGDDDAATTHAATAAFTWTTSALPSTHTRTSTRPRQGALCVCTSLVHEIRGSQPISCCLDRFDSFVPIYPFSLAGGHSMSLGLCPTKLPVTSEERTDHPLVPATKFVTSLSCRLYMVPFCDILTVQTHLSRAAQVDSLAFAYMHGCSNLFLARWLHVHDPHDITLQCA